MDWFKHDINAHEDIKIRKLKRMHGMAAYGVYWELVELMYSKGGTLPESSILDEIMLMGIEEDDARDMVDSFLDLGLFRSDGETWTSDRVEEEFTAANSRRQKMSELGKRSGAARQRAVNEPLTHRQRTVNAPLNETIEERRDYNSSSPLQEESNKNKSNNNYTGTPPIVCPELPKKGRLEAGTPQDSVFLSIISNKGEEVMIRESFVKMLEETYPAVDVRAELRSMKAWSISNPKNRKTAQGMKAFINNWLKRDQDRAGRIPQHNMEVIRGTNIGMTLVADGTRPDQEYKEVHFE